MLRYKWPGKLCVLLTILIGSTFPVRAQAPTTFPYCLFSQQDDGSVWRLDLNDDTYRQMRGPYDRYLRNLEGLYSKSPDGRFAVYLGDSRISAVSVLTIYNLYMKPAGGGEARLLEPIVFYDDDQRYGHLFLRGAWSRDSRQFAYMWMSTDFATYVHQTLTLVNADGTNRRDAEISHAPWSDSTFEELRLREPDFWGWSPDGQYLLTTQGALSDPYASVNHRVFQFWDAKTLKPVIIPTRHYGGRSYEVAEIYEVAWAPQGHQFALVEHASTYGAVTVITPEQGIAASLQLPTTGLVEDMDGRPKPEWAPDGSAIAFRYVDNAITKYYLGSLDIFTPDNRHTWQVSRTVNRGSGARWSADGHYYVFSEGEYENTTLARFDTLTVQTEEMQKGLLSDPFETELSNKTYLVNWQSGDTTHYGVIDSSANMVIRLYESTEKSITPSISPDKKLIFLSFSTSASREQPVAPHEWLVWGTVDGPLTHTFDPGFEKLSGYWSKDNRTLLYIGEKAKAWEVGAIDSISGNRRVFFTEAPDLQALYVPSKNNEVPFGDIILLLKQTDGTSRLFVYDQGRALNYYFDRADLQEVKRSPVDDAIFAEFGKEPDVSLYLARPDELSRPALREHLLKAYSWPGWSPDGRLLAFTQFDQGEERTLEIVDAEGVLIRRYHPLHEPVYFIADEWSPCTEN